MHNGVEMCLLQINIVAVFKSFNPEEKGMTFIQSVNTLSGMVGAPVPANPFKFVHDTWHVIIIDRWDLWLRYAYVHGHVFQTGLRWCYCSDSPQPVMPTCVIRLLSGLLQD